MKFAECLLANGQRRLYITPELPLNKWIDKYNKQDQEGADVKSGFEVIIFMKENYRHNNTVNRFQI